MSLFNIEIDGFTITIITLVFLMGLAFQPTRSLIAWMLKTIASGIGSLLKSLFAAIHEAGKRLLDAHITWLLNWRPRIMVLPNIDTPKSTNRNE